MDLAGFVVFTFDVLQDQIRTNRFRNLAVSESRCKATWKRVFELAWREAGPPTHHNDEVDLDQ